MASPWQWYGAGWWWRLEHATGWIHWMRQGGWTPGEGGHRARPPREPGCLVQLETGFTGNALCRTAACPHEAYVAFQRRLQWEYGAKLRPAMVIRT